MSARPTPASPARLNGDGTVSLLLFEGRTNRFVVVHRGLLDPEGWAARAAWAARFGGDPLLEASTEDGSIVVDVLVDEDDAPVGTSFTVTVSDDGLESPLPGSGVWDMLMESPEGEEVPLVPSSSWWLWKAVAE